MTLQVQTKKFISSALISDVQRSKQFVLLARAISLFIAILDRSVSLQGTRRYWQAIRHKRNTFKLFGPLLKEVVAKKNPIFKWTN